MKIFNPFARRGRITVLGGPPMSGKTTRLRAAQPDRAFHIRAACETPSSIQNHLEAAGRGETVCIDEVHPTDERMAERLAQAVLAASERGVHVWLAVESVDVLTASSWSRLLRKARVERLVAA